MASVPRALVDDDTREALKLVIDVQTRKDGRARRAVQ